MADIRVSQLSASGAVQVGNDLRLTQFYAFAAVTAPAQDVRVTGVRVDAAVQFGPSTAHLTQLFMLVAVRGRIYDPRVRAWTFTLDGHDFYVLRLGNTETLVYDLSTEQWHVWGSLDTPLWKAYNGMTWQGGARLSDGYGSNIVVTDDANGALYFLSPEEYTDDDAVEGDTLQRNFTREAPGQIPVEGYGKVPCYDINVFGSVGKNDASLTAATLYYSDDQGVTYTDAGTITVPSGTLTTRLSWRSLGSMMQPGRLFKIKDEGALIRLDYTEVNSGKNPDAS